MNLIETGKELLKLGQEYRDVNTGDTSEWVKQGLMTPEEYQDYEAYSNIMSKAYVIRQAAEQAVPRPEIDYPEKYATLKAEQDKVLAQLKEIDTAVEGYHQFDAYRGYPELSCLSLATKITELRRRLENSLEYRSLGEQKRDLSDRLYRLTRKGTIVARLETEAQARYELIEQEAGERAYNDFIAKNKDIVDAGKLAERAGAKRVRERQQTIIAQMAGVLEGQNA